MKKILLIISLFFALTVSAFAAEGGSLRFAWDKPLNYSPAGYNIYYGTTSQVYTDFKNMGHVTTYLVENLVPGETYFFALRAYDNLGIESVNTDELSVTVVDATSMIEPVPPINTTCTQNIVVKNQTWIGVQEPPVCK